jgi:hypothetical protein
MTPARLLEMIAWRGSLGRRGCTLPEGSKECLDVLLNLKLVYRDARGFYVAAGRYPTLTEAGRYRAHAWRKAA